jgi:hypothetical protein
MPAKTIITNRQRTARRMALTLCDGAVNTTLFYCLSTHYDSQQTLEALSSRHDNDPTTG